MEAVYQGYDVRFGSLAAATELKRDIRFPPESCRGTRWAARQLRANQRQRTAALAAFWCSTLKRQIAEPLHLLAVIFDDPISLCGR